MNEKHERMRQFCEANGHDGVLLRRRANIAWITDGADTHIDTASALGFAAALWTPQRMILLTDNIEAPRLRDEEPLAEWEIRSDDWWDEAAQDELLRHAFVEAGVQADRVANDWPDDAIAELRWSLTAAEIERVQALGRDTAEVVERLLKIDVQPGMTERHLGGAMAGWLRDRGIFAHVVLVAADERLARYRHPIPTGRAIERVAMAAVCAQRQGLIVSVTRLVHFGDLLEDLRRRHDAVCRVDAALHAATKPGTRWCDALAAGVRAYEEAGFADEWRLHHQGGPMGYECREFKATPTETRTVREYQLVGWNPTITGTKSEDTILTRPDGAIEVITHTGGWPMREGRPDILVR